MGDVLQFRRPGNSAQHIQKTAVAAVETPLCDEITKLEILVQARRACMNLSRIHANLWCRLVCQGQGENRSWNIMAVDPDKNHHQIGEPIPHDRLEEMRAIIDGPLERWITSIKLRRDLRPV